MVSIFYQRRKTELTLYSFPSNQAKIEKMKVIFGQIEEKIQMNSRISVFLDWTFPRIPKTRKRTFYMIHPKSRLPNSNYNVKSKATVDEYQEMFRLTHKNQISSIQLRFKL